MFYWDASSSPLPAANGGTIIGTWPSGRWIRVHSGAVNVRWFGARSDDMNATPQDAALSAAIAVAKAGKTELLFPRGPEGATYAFSSTLTLDGSNGVRLRGLGTKNGSVQLHYIGGGSGTAISATGSTGLGSMPIG